MSETLTPKLLIVGGGPGGYVAAIRAGQLGIDTVLVEADRLGGTCLIRGCIPSKVLIHAAGLYDEMVETSRKQRFGITLTKPPKLNIAKTVAWKNDVVDKLNSGVTALLKRANVKVITGWARFSDAKSCAVDTGRGQIQIVAEHVLMATGSVPVELPGLPFGGKVISSSEALSPSGLPQSLVVVGAGYVGLELGVAYRKLGVAVTIVEARDRILPQYDRQLTDPVHAWLVRHGVTVYLGAKALGLEGGDDGSLLIETSEGDGVALEADRVLVTIGRKPNLSGWGLEQMNLAMRDGFVRVDDRCQTATTNVWAIGDLIGEPMLAHKASAQGEMVAEIISGVRRRFDATVIPEVCFTEPEIVSVGTSVDVVGNGDEFLVGRFPFAANGRALSMDVGDDGGFVRVIARKADHRIVGIQAVGAHISELSSQFATLIEMGAVLEDVAGIIHAHPTMGEAVFEASLKASDHAIHI